jgi:uncharacterized protein with NRDE domain
MCTLVVAHRVVEHASVVVLANRDEFLARPSVAPAVRDRKPSMFCGLDAKGGGTWFGVNAFGLVVGLTNLTLRMPAPELRSRGLLCMDMLELRTAQLVREALEALPAKAYNPFNLVALDGTTAVRASYDDAPRVQALEPGVYATTNWPVGSDPDAKRMAAEQRVRAMLDAAANVDEIVEGLKNEGRRHDGNGDPRASVCCHAPGYGTRASTIALVDPMRGNVRVLHADGPPCTSDYEDHTGEVATMMAFKEF